MTATRKPTPAQARVIVEAIEHAEWVGKTDAHVVARRDMYDRMRDAGWVEEGTARVTDAGRAAVGRAVEAAKVEARPAYAAADWTHYRVAYGVDGHLTGYVIDGYRSTPDEARAVAVATLEDCRTRNDNPRVHYVATVDGKPVGGVACMVCPARFATVADSIGHEHMTPGDAEAPAVEAPKPTPDFQANDVAGYRGARWDVNGRHFTPDAGWLYELRRDLGDRKFEFVDGVREADLCDPDCDGDDVICGRCEDRFAAARYARAEAEAERRYAAEAEDDAWRDCGHRADFASAAEHERECPAHGLDATDEAPAPVVTVERAKLYPTVATPGPAWRWAYAYSVDGGPRAQYGTGLASLRSMLKRHFPGARIVEAWAPARNA